MKSISVWLAALASGVIGLFLTAGVPFASVQAQDNKVRVIVFGAHPDDPEIGASGVATMWSARGHAVKLVAVTNGDIGHFKEAGGQLYRRRKAEVERAAKNNG
jgi:LmbE family N-acetylglucosaminyl deacetylase